MPGSPFTGTADFGEQTGPLFAAGPVDERFGRQVVLLDALCAAGGAS